MGIASRIIKELLRFDEENKLSKNHHSELQTIITYLRNQKNRMQYHKNIKNNYPIGSGVTEAACKTTCKKQGV